MARPAGKKGVLGQPDGGGFRLAVSLATVLGLAAALLAGSGARAEPATSSTFLKEALGRPLASAPFASTIRRGLETKVERRGYTVASKSASISVASEGVGDREWRAFANGFSRHVPFGRETIVTEPRKTEQFFTVERAQGLRTWRWSLRSPGFRPRLTRNGAIEFVSQNRLGDLMIAPVAIFDSTGKDITPSGLRWSLRLTGSSWQLETRFDDAGLRLPYVLDPAITFEGSSTGSNMGATTLVIPKPSGVVAGDFLIAQVTVRGGSTTTITAPTGWTLLRRENSATALAQAIYRKFAGATEPSTYTWTFSSSRKASGGIIAYAGVDTTSPIDASSGNTGNSSSITALSVTTTGPDRKIVGFFGLARTTGITSPASMTERYQEQSAGGGGATEHAKSVAADADQATAGPTGNKTALASQGAEWVAHLVALRPAAAAPRTTSTTVDCPATTPANSPATCTVTVTDTATGTKSPPQGTVDLAVTAQPAGSIATVAPDPCALAPDPSPATDDSSCTVTFTANTLGSYTITGSYQPAAASVHAASSGSDTITVTARSTSTTVDCPATTPANSPATCTVTVTDTGTGTKSPPQGTVDLAVTAQPAGSTATVAPDPCMLAPDPSPATDDSSCTITFTGDKPGNYTIEGSYQPTSAHATSSGSDTIEVKARTTTTTVDCPATTPANTPATCTVTVTDTDAAPKSPPKGTVDFEFTAQPAGSSPTLAPDPCLLTANNGSSSGCTITFTAGTLGSYTIKGTYQPAAASVHAASSGTDTITVTARSTSTVVDCPATTPANTPATCTVTVTDTDAAPKSPPQGTVDFEFTAQPAGSSPTLAPDPCLLTANNGSSSGCTITFTAGTLGSYTIEGSYQPTSAHATSSGSDTIEVKARTTTTTVDCPATTPANTPATCTVTVTDTDAAPKSPPQGTVDFEFTAQPAGSSPTLAPDPCPLTPNNGSSSGCTVVFNSTKAGDYTIKGTYQPTSVHASSFDSDRITVTAGPPAIVRVDPPAASNEVNTRHCVTATVTDEFGNPNAGVTVFFTVTGVNSASGSGTTGADGRTQFCYTGRLFGVDTITAVADADDDGNPEPGEPTGTATKTWLLPPSTAFCDVDFVTYGIRIIAANGDLGTGGGNARVDGDGNPTGQHEYQDHGPVQPMNVHSINVLAVVCTDIEGVPGGKQAQIYGEATIDGAGSHNYRIDVEDRGEPGTGNDKYWILLSTGYDSGNQTLIGGNVQIH